MERVAVIGANGYVGKRLCKTLLKNNIEVISFSAGGTNGISLKTGLFANDLTFPLGLDTIYFLAQSPHYHQMPDFSAHLLSVNCVAATQAVDAARKAGAKRFIYASTGNVYQQSFSAISEDDPVCRNNWYALSKVMAEDVLALYRPYLDITVARIFGVYGPEQTNKLVPMIADKIETNQEIFIDKHPYDSNDIDGLSVSLIYIDDLVNALFSLGQINHCNIINLAGTESVSIRTLATELSQGMGIPAKIIIKDKERAFNLIANIQLQTKLLGNPVMTLTEGIQRFCHERKKR